MRREARRLLNEAEEAEEARKSEKQALTPRSEHEGAESGNGDGENGNGDDEREEKTVQVVEVKTKRQSFFRAMTTKKAGENDKDLKKKKTFNEAKFKEMRAAKAAARTNSCDGEQAVQMTSSTSG